MSILRRTLGWTSLVGMAGIAAYLVNALWLTGFETARAQEQLRAEWESTASAVEDPLIGTSESHSTRIDDSALQPGDAFAVLWFERAGQRVVTDDELYVVEGVGADQLSRGIGHYPGTAVPGLTGNVAIAGHRTTYGAPFWSLDLLRHGDTAHLVDPNGTEWVYRFVHQQVVTPEDTEVLQPDPLGTGAPVLTLTTCHPKHSSAQRLVVLAELIEQRQTDTQSR